MPKGIVFSFLSIYIYIATDSCAAGDFLDKLLVIAAAVHKRYNLSC
jgi:Na+-transporting methylmalonyl-CoA/oxaloacetate decarboxylase gamma subunit